MVFPKKKLHTKDDKNDILEKTGGYFVSISNY